MTQGDFVEDKFLYWASSDRQDQGCWGTDLWTGFSYNQKSFWCWWVFVCLFVCMFVCFVILYMAFFYPPSRQQAAYLFKPATFPCNSSRCPIVSCMCLCVESRMLVHPPIHLYLCVQCSFPVILLKTYKNLPIYSNEEVGFIIKTVEVKRHGTHWLLEGEEVRHKCF